METEFLSLLASLLAIAGAAVTWGVARNQIAQNEVQIGRMTESTIPALLERINALEVKLARMQGRSDAQSSRSASDR